jgi:hypothetical protein
VAKERTPYTNRVVRISELVIVGDIIEDSDFVNCHLLGPALCAPLEEVAFLNCVFEGDIDAILWELPKPKQVVGAIGLRRCRFDGCKLSSIGLVGLPGLIQNFRAQLRPGGTGNPP